MIGFASGALGSNEFGADTCLWAATGRAGGASTGVYQSLNLAEYVGDDAGAVAENRRRAVGLVGVGVDGLAVMEAVHDANVGVVSCGGVVAGLMLSSPPPRELPCSRWRLTACRSSSRMLEPGSSLRCTVGGVALVPESWLPPWRPCASSAR